MVVCTGLYAGRRHVRRVGHQQEVLVEVLARPHLPSRVDGALNAALNRLTGIRKITESKTSNLMSKYCIQMKRK